MRRIATALLLACRLAAAAPCEPGQPCWPAPAEWKQLAGRLKGKLLEPRSMLSPCVADSKSAACASLIAGPLKNPYWIEDQPGGTQSLGWLDAWQPAQSAWAVAAESAADVAQAVDFARRHHLRVAVKGTGHDYLGRSNAAGSLLIWTHRMRDVTRHDAFVAKGCAGPGVPAVSVGAGTRWIEAYHAVTSVGGRYVQGGGCTSVGAAGGFLQGGGFGSWSKKFGIAAASLLEAEVVTADGKIRVASACQNSDLFWALRGGGGGTFGVVTRATLRTHPLPSYFGFALGTIQAKSDRAFEELLRRFVHFYRDALDNERWGEQVRVRSDDALDVRMSFQGLTAEAAEQVWKPLREWIASRTDLTVELHFAAIPGRQAWDEETIEKRFPGVTTPDPDGRSERFWWSGNQGEVATYWWAYQSRWLPIDLFDDAHAAGLAHTLFAASRHWPLELHFNKGQSGASAEALARDRETSVNPVVLRSAALVIVAANGAGSPEVPGKTPDRKEGERSRAGVSAAMKILRDATPGSGSYVNETDYFEPDWQRSFWGDGYPRLLSVKHTYDPDGLFTCHHCVGSEEKAKTR